MQTETMMKQHLGNQSNNNNNNIATTDPEVQPLMTQETFNAMWNALSQDQTLSIGQPLEIEFNHIGPTSASDGCVQVQVDRFHVRSQNGGQLVGNDYSLSLPESMMNSPKSCSPHSMDLSLACIPINTNYAGHYHFSLSFPLQPIQTTTKSALWTFSEVVNKLYVKMAAMCPIRFTTLAGVALPHGCVLRALPVFRQPEHIKQVVTRCPNHTCSKDKDAMNDGHPAPSHLIRCEHSQVNYQQEYMGSGRQSVVIPYEQPQAGAEYMQYMYSFMCYGSCVGGLNRRPLQVIFTLEQNGIVLGRRVLDVRICACPGRDRKNDEDITRYKEKGCRPPKRKASSKGFQMMQLSKRDKGDEVYYLEVRGKDHYDILRHINESLEIMDRIPEEQLSKYRAHRDSRLLPLGEPVVTSTETMIPALTRDNTIPVEDSDHSCSRSITKWLTDIGCKMAIGQFLNRNILSTSQLDVMSLEDVETLGLDADTVDVIQRQLISRQKIHIPSLTKRTPSSCSNTSFESMAALLNSNAGSIEATRFTLKHTFSWINKL